MTEGRSLLGITEKDIKRTGVAFTTTRDFVLPDWLYFVYQKRETIAEQQPMLSSYLWYMNSSVIRYRLLFDLGAALIYDMLPKKLKQEVLSEDAIKTAHRSIQEEISFQPVPGSDEAEEAIDFSWLRAKFTDDSKTFKKWLGKIESRLSPDHYHLYYDFLIGVLITALPFYMRAEAQQLDRKLYYPA